jgi:cytosine/adenosine deaminase-related metal-dependent hydrolase
VIENCAVATMDGPRHDQGGTEYRSGHVTVTGDRITAVGEGPAASVPDGARRIDAGGCLATPGLVNTHHHLYQWLTQGRAQQSVLFDWLTEPYPVWATIDAGQVHAAATAGLAWLALSGCTTSTDHHYIFPRDALRGGGDARQALGLGTRGGARCLGRDDETGALRPGLLADIALWRLDGLAHDAIAHGPGGDPVAALVLGPPAPLELLLVGGTPVLDGGELRTVDAATATREVRAARLRLAGPELS